MHFARILLSSASVGMAFVLSDPRMSLNSIPFSTRVHWMRQANAALEVVTGSPCPFAAFGTVIVNHTNTDGLGDLVCIGANENSLTGNPTLHGEMAAIKNCTTILTDPNGRFKLTASETEDAFADLTLYTNAESCPMCAAGIRWAGFREYIYGTSIDRLIERGWGQIRIPSIDIFQASFDLPNAARLMGNLLVNETDPYFLWQYDPTYPCPMGCSRSQDGKTCEAT